MCERSEITDPEIIQLCEEIVQAQEEEIARMEAILERSRQSSEWNFVTAAGLMEGNIRIMLRKKRQL